MTDTGEEITKLIIEGAEMCHNCTPCNKCGIDKFREDFNIKEKSMNCGAVYIVMKLLGCNEYSAEYYMDQRHRLEKICHENDGRCFRCKFRNGTEGINCLCYIIGKDLLRDV